MIFAIFENFTDLAKWAEWIGAAFGALDWALRHPATAAWFSGLIMIAAVFHKGWPTANVPEIDSPLGKLIVYAGLGLVLVGFSWRAVDEVLGTRAGHTRNAQTLSVPPSSTPPASQRFYQPDGGG